jgi:hypothetical protein
MLRILATALVVSSAYRGPRGPAQRLRRRRAVEALEGAEAAALGETTEPWHVFWDLDNKRPKDLDAAMALLPSFGEMGMLGCWKGK